jgi:hypothetical protein
MRVPQAFQLFGLAMIILGFAPGNLHAADASSPPETEADDAIGDVTLLPPLEASAGRIEDFGFRVSPAYDPARSALFKRVYSPVVDVVLPNTAAARAGMKPGDRIVSADGEPTASRTFSIKKWRRIQEAKWAEVAAGAKNVAWTLEAEDFVTRDRRTLVLRIPTPAPHWGGARWQKPDRPPAVVVEAGPLAERAARVLENGIWILLRRSYVLGLDLPVSETRPFFLCYQWTLQSESGGHRIYVSQQRGRTDIILEAISAEAGAELSKTAATSAPVPTLASATTVFARESRVYLTSPSGALEKAWSLSQKESQQEIPLEFAREEFQREIDFWLNQTAPVARWPLAVITEKTPAAGETMAPPGLAPTIPRAVPLSPPASELASAFQRLPRATAEQRALFSEAFDKIGADADRWAYTEISRRPGEKHPTIVRVDPSKPAAARYTLLGIGGKAPTPEDLLRWREEGGESSDPLGELGNIRESVDVADVRIFAIEATATVFELPMLASAAGVSADKLQTLFRVNNSTRALEDIVVKLREPMRVTAGAKVTEAGLEARFRTVHPAYPPQPVRLRGGGTARLLLMKISRDFEITRTSYKRVEPYAEAE